MSNCKPFVGDEKTRIKVQITGCDGTALDVSTASSIVIRFVKADAGDLETNVLVEKTAQLLNGGTDGWVYYDAEPAFFDVSGTYQGQAFVTFPSGKWHTEIFSFSAQSPLSV